MIFGQDRKAKPQAAAKPTRPAVEIETVIGPNTVLKGDINSSGGVRIDGDFSGTIDIAGNLIIGEHAQVVATISANNVQIQGSVQGNVTAKRLEILDTGRLWGDIAVDSFVLDDGGFFRGQSKMQRDIEPPLLEAPRSQATSGDIVDVEPVRSTDK